MGPELPGVAAWLAVSLVPLAAVCCTAFAKASVVFSAVRVGLGAEGLLPWSAVFALAVVVSAVVMGPVLQESAALWSVGGPVDVVGSWGVLEAFLSRHAEASEVAYFAGLNEVAPAHPLAVVPAFLVTELGEALEMAVVIVVPFVLVDLCVAQLVALAGLSGQVASSASLPVKLMLFLAVGGWDVVVRGLAEGYA